HIQFRVSVSCSPHASTLHSFPTRRSSDLDRFGNHLRQSDRCERGRGGRHGRYGVVGVRAEQRHPAVLDRAQRREWCAVAAAYPRDRKSTRLNSSHVKISYAVFCLKKKNKR